MTKAFESTESSSPLITRAVASGLQGEYSENYIFPTYQRKVLELLGYFPQEFSRVIISSFQTVSGLNPACLDGFSIDTLIDDRLRDYDGNRGKFPVIVSGAGLGGATTYLSLALNAPFLPQSFVISLKNGSFGGNADEYLQRSMAAALEIAKKDPRLMTIQHFDPVHDGWLTKFVNHLRFKLIDFPEKYKLFIKSHLEKGGTFVFLNCKAEWLRYRIGDRSVFQIGGWGDITPEEFLYGSERLQDYARKNHLKHASWKLRQSEFPLESGPESEWGCEPGLSEQIENFCLAEGYQFVNLNLKHPEDISKLSFFTAKKMIEMDGNEPAGTQIECFSQFDCTSSFASSLLPLWLIFNTNDSANYLEKMMVQIPSNKPIFFSPLSTFSLTPDMAPWNRWEEIIKSEFVNIGTRKSHYPSDPKALLHWSDPLRNWVTQNPRPIKSRISAEDLVSIYSNLYK